MNIQSISFKTGPPRSGSGFPLPTNSSTPKMRGRKNIDLRVEIKHIDSVIELLSDVPCNFWACKGPSYPRNMITCSKCYAIRELSGVRMTLINQLNKGEY